MKKRILAAALCGMLLCACGEKKEESSSEMQYIKTAVLYDTITDMYENPDQYLNKTYHMVGTLYPSKDDDGNVLYSIYAKDPGSDHGIGVELDWSDFSGFSDYDKVTVEGKLEQEHGQYQGEKIDYLVLRVSLLEKRE